MRFLYHYRVAYAFDGGQGAADMKSKKKIGKNITDLEEQLREKAAVPKLKILNYQLLRKQRIG